MQHESPLLIIPLKHVRKNPREESLRGFFNEITACVFAADDLFV